MPRLAAFALLLALIGGWSGGADARARTLAGSWFLDVTPQAVLPDFPVPPPPFVAIFNFGFAGTVTETDSSVNANSIVALFPPDILPPFSGSDGYGRWKRVGDSRFECFFIKMLFDETGLQIGFVNTTLDLVVNADGTLEGGGPSEFVMGSDPDGAVFFSGPVVVDGARLRAGD